MQRTLEAAEDFGVDIEELARAIQSNEALAALVTSALDATRRTRLEQKARAFGRAIANGSRAQDDAQIDIERMVIQTIDVLEQPHIDALELMTHAKATEQDPGIKVTPNLDYAGAIDDMRRVLGPTAATPVLALLEREGLVPDGSAAYDGVPSPDEATKSFLTEYGARVREYLLDLADD